MLSVPVAEFGSRRHRDRETIFLPLIRPQPRLRAAAPGRLGSSPADRTMPAMAELLLKRATAASVEVYDVLSGSRIVVGSCYPMRRRHHSGSGQCPTATTKAARRPAAMPSPERPRCRHSRRVATASQAYPQRPSNNMDHHRGAEFDIRLLLPARLRTLV